MSSQSSAPLQITYEGVPIAYHESDNLWRFELRGRQRSAESLAKAKEYIDKPAPEGKKAFERIPAIHLGYFDHIPDKGEITSLAEARGYYSNRIEVWFVGGDKSRIKISAKDCYIPNDENIAKIAKIQANQKEIKRLEDNSCAIFATLAAVDLSGCE